MPHEPKAWPPPDLQEDVPLTYPALLLKYAPMTPSYVPAVLSSDDPARAVTYGSLLTHVCELALELRNKYGVRDGKAVVILMEKSPRYIQVLLATLVAGGAYIPLSPRDPPTLLEKVVENVHPVVAFCDAGLFLKGVPIVVPEEHLEAREQPSADLLEQVHCSALLCNDDFEQSVTTYLIY